MRAAQPIDQTWARAVVDTMPGSVISARVDTDHREIRRGRDLVSSLTYTALAAQLAQPLD